MKTTKAQLLILGAIVSTLASPTAHAVLGASPVGKREMTPNFSTQQSATDAHSNSSAKFQVYTSTASNGSTVREYVTNNVVFAVSWSGAPSHPDLALPQLLGGDYGIYQTALDSHPKKKGRAAHTVATDDLVVTKSGQQRDNRGLAYKKSLLPAGVSAADLQ